MLVWAFGIIFVFSCGQRYFVKRRSCGQNFFFLLFILKKYLCAYGHHGLKADSPYSQSVTIRASTNWTKCPTTGAVRTLKLMLLMQTSSKCWYKLLACFADNDHERKNCNGPVRRMLQTDGPASGQIKKRSGTHQLQGSSYRKLTDQVGSCRWWPFRLHRYPGRRVASCEKSLVDIERTMQWLRGKIMPLKYLQSGSEGRENDKKAIQVVVSLL